MRSEAEIVADLSLLCRSDGYVHTLGFLCFRDNFVCFDKEMRPEHLARMFSPERLCRSEISSLIGLLIKGEINWNVPSIDVAAEQMERTDALMKELHEAIMPSSPQLPGEGPDPKSGEVDFVTRGDFLREAIFYSGESAYSFQYRDIGEKKYAADNEWLRLNKGFLIEEAKEVTSTITKLLDKKLAAAATAMATLPRSEQTLLPGFTFTVEEIAAVCDCSRPVVEAVIAAFTLPVGEQNAPFQSVTDFNAYNASSLLRWGAAYVLLQWYSIFEALYDSPFYWMGADEQYVAAAMKNRGKFTEKFCAERLTLVFGQDRVHKNVYVIGPDGNRAGEIDVLVVFGNRAIVVQAKSKRLTLEARKGNGGQIRDDFRKGVQESYGQARNCAQWVDEDRFKLVRDDGAEISLPARMREIYILCVVSDHYPSLSFQVQQFLEYDRTSVIQPPLVCDVFGLDVMTEMLPSPLRFLSYVSRRANYAGRFFSSHEVVILSYHLKHNLWLDDDLTRVWLCDDISADLDAAMTVRRDGVPGQRTPDGILTRWTSTVVGRILAKIESHPDPPLVDFGFLLLSLNEGTMSGLAKGITTMSELAQLDGGTHDFTIGLGKASDGITIHCTAEPLAKVVPRLRDHCERRKYTQKAGNWFGVCLRASDESPMAFLKLEYEWNFDLRMEERTRGMLRSSNFSPDGKSWKKIGRNHRCPCKSGLKYKMCCGI